MGIIIESNGVSLRKKVQIRGEKLGSKARVGRRGEGNTRWWGWKRQMCLGQNPQHEELTFFNEGRGGKGQGRFCAE